MSTEQLFIYDKWKKKRKAEKIICENCGKEVICRTFTNRVNKYCSIKCFHISQEEKVEVICLDCGKTINKTKSKVKNRNFCNRSCKENFFSKENHPLWIGGKFSYRDRAIKKYGLNCKRGDLCPLKNINLPRYMFEVDHIDGNRDNNNIENLQILCIYCHREKTIGALVEKHNTTFAK